MKNARPLNTTTNSKEIILLGNGGGFNVKAWHFLPANKLLKYGDGREVTLGETIKVDPDKLKLCEYGLHASERAIDALKYLSWDNAIMCRVELGALSLRETIST